MTHYTQSQLASMGKAELMELARSMNLKVNDSYNKGNLVAAIGAAQDLVQAGGKVHASETESHKSDLDTGHAVIKVGPGRYDRGKLSKVPVQLSYQGRMVHIPKDIPITVPDIYLEILEDACTVDYHQDNEGEAAHEEIVARYPVHVLRHNPSDRYLEKESRRKQAAA